jgi:hypothetical protein
MPETALQNYLEALRVKHRDPLYIPRRFAVPPKADEVPSGMQAALRGSTREQAPQLDELLSRSRVAVLGEPGAGKSRVARAAVRQLAESGARIPIFCALREYRREEGLTAIIRRELRAMGWENTYEDLLDIGQVACIFDGADEVPFEAQEQFFKDLNGICSEEQTGYVFLTARQAFWARRPELSRHFSSVLDLLEFSDDDVREFVDRKGIDSESFLAAIKKVGTHDEIRNPFILELMTSQFQKDERLTDSRFETLSLIVTRHIDSHGDVSAHEQRRALRMLAVAMQTSGRVELSNDDALQLLERSMPISRSDAQRILEVLHHSIVRASEGGISFLLNSYGEFLAAEELADADLDRVRQLAFVDYNTPNDLWANTFGFLAEVNREVRRFLLESRPLWLLKCPARHFSYEECDVLVGGVLKTIAGENFIRLQLGVDLRQIAKFITPGFQGQLVARLTAPESWNVANILLLLSWCRHPGVPELARKILLDRNKDLRLRQYAAEALSHYQRSDLVQSLLDGLQEGDPAYDYVLEAAAALSTDAQLSLVLPLISRTGTLLSKTFYRFRELRSELALHKILAYFASSVSDLNEPRIDGYVEPAVNDLPKHWNPKTAELCADIVDSLDSNHAMLWDNRLGWKLLGLIYKADKGGEVALRCVKALDERYDDPSTTFIFTKQIIGYLMKPESIPQMARTTTIERLKSLTPFASAATREAMRPILGGYLEELEQNTAALKAEQELDEDTRKRRLADRQSALLQAPNLQSTLEAFSRLPESNWPDLPGDRLTNLANELSGVLNSLDLRNTIMWSGNQVTIPSVVPIAMRLISRYRLEIRPDDAVAHIMIAMQEGAVAEYFKRVPISDSATRIVEQLLGSPRSERDWTAALTFLVQANIWTPAIASSCLDIVKNSSSNVHQLSALQLLERNGVKSEDLVHVFKHGSSEDLKQAAFRMLIGRQHRETIERALDGILKDETGFQRAETSHPFGGPISWITNIKAEFALEKLTKLRAMSLRFELQGNASTITGTMMQIDRKKTARIIRNQISMAPVNWQSAQLQLANDQDALVRIEAIQSTPFAKILNKLQRATSFNRFKLVCEGKTDIPVFRRFLSEIPDIPEVTIIPVGGWPNLPDMPKEFFLDGCKDVMVVMDGDGGRKYSLKGSKLNPIAKREESRLSGLGVTLQVLQRYGIENYFTQRALENVLGKPVPVGFPIPDHVKAVEYLSPDDGQLWTRIKKFLKFKLRLPIPLKGVYSKGLNGDVVSKMSLDTDLKGTDLYEIIHEIADRSRKISGK